MVSTAVQNKREISAGERFEFGKNWASFLCLLDDKRIERAETSLSEMLDEPDLAGKKFLDIGSGSGLFSLAAKRLGARVYSFDYDPDSVACTKELKNRYFPVGDDWQIHHGSALDSAYIASLGEFDVVYSWGVLHHTGKMWDALQNAGLPVRDGGLLLIAIYNDTGSQAKRWHWIKQSYCKLPKPLKPVFAVFVTVPEEAKRLLSCLFRGQPVEYIRYWRDYRNTRGMSRWRDIVDWVGGFPYEVASPEEIFEFYTSRNFRLVKMKTRGVGLGCNEFVFERVAVDHLASPR